LITDRHFSKQTLIYYVEQIDEKILHYKTTAFELANVFITLSLSTLKNALVLH